MSSTTVQAHHDPARRLPVAVPDALVIAAVAAFLLGLFLRVITGSNSPLWLDETWTGAIAMQPSMREVFEQAYAEVNAPFYYVFMHAWAALFGISNASLRLPSLLLSVATPLLCLLPVPAIPPKVRWTWSALLSLWFPAAYYAQEARCYSLLLFLSVAGTIALIRLLERPTLPRAGLWAGIGALICLTHYHGLFLVGCQGIAYLAIHRKRALATWPAALLFVPVFGWIAHHLPRITAYADPNVNWYPPFGLEQLGTLAAFMFGSSLSLAFLVILAAAAVLFADGRDADTKGAPWPLRVAPLSALAGLALVIGVAVLHPSFTFRYAIPFEPGILLGIAMLAARLQRRWASIPIALIAASGVTAIKASAEPVQKDYNFQVASEWLMGSGVRNLVFFWDHPSNAFVYPKQLDIVGGFFLRRAGIDATVTPIKLRQGEDPTARLLEAAAGQAKIGILWTFNTTDGHVAAQLRPPRFETLAPNWTCRNFGHGSLGIVACHPGT